MIVDSIRKKLSGLFGLFGGEEEAPDNIGIYGPPNSGKTTLTNRIVSDWTEMDSNELGSASEVPHETREAEKRSVEIGNDTESVSINVIDTPGVETSVDYEEFVEHDIEEDAAIERSREATEGIAEAMQWLRSDVDGAIYMVDSTEDPFTQLNTMTVGIIESQDIPAIILANKIDLDDSNVDRVRNAFPQHQVIPVSAKDGDNIEDVYDAVAENFG